MRHESPSIGLKRGTVELRAADPAWPAAFRAEVARLERRIDEARLPQLLFEHIGSTAVPGLDAKPIIDMMAGHAPGVDPRGYFAAIQAAGYECRGPQGVPDRELFVLGTDARRTHHLNLVRYDGQFWNQHAMFRDRLRLDPELRAAYSQLKRRLAAAHADDRGAYTAGKADFIAQVLHRISGTL